MCEDVRNCHSQAVYGADIVVGELEDAMGTILTIYLASGHDVCLAIVHGEYVVVTCPSHAQLPQGSVVFSEHVEACVFSEFLGVEYGPEWQICSVVCRFLYEPFSVAVVVFWPPEFREWEGLFLLWSQEACVESHARVQVAVEKFITKV
jgi:hypothetical protein